MQQLTARVELDPMDFLSLSSTSHDVQVIVAVSFMGMTFVFSNDSYTNFSTYKISKSPFINNTICIWFLPFLLLALPITQRPSFSCSWGHTFLKCSTEGCPKMKSVVRELIQLLISGFALGICWTQVIHWRDAKPGWGKNARTFWKHLS